MSPGQVSLAKRMTTTSAMKPADRPALTAGPLQGLPVRFDIAPHGVVVMIHRPPCSRGQRRRSLWGRGCQQDADLRQQIPRDRRDRFLAEPHSLPGPWPRRISPERPAEATGGWRMDYLA